MQLEDLTPEQRKLLDKLAGGVMVWAYWRDHASQCKICLEALERVGRDQG